MHLFKVNNGLRYRYCCVVVASVGIAFLSPNVIPPLQGGFSFGFNKIALIIRELGRLLNTIRIQFGFTCIVILIIGCCRFARIFFRRVGEKIVSVRYVIVLFMMLSITPDADGFVTHSAVLCGSVRWGTITDFENSSAYNGSLPAVKDEMPMNFWYMASYTNRLQSMVHGAIPLGKYLIKIFITTYFD